MANGLKERGHDIHIVTLDGDGDTFYPLHREIQLRKLDMATPGKPSRKISVVTSLHRLRSIASWRPEVVVGFMHSIYVPLSVALIGCKLKLIASEHVGIRHFERRPLERQLVRATAPLFCGRTVPSEFMISEYSRLTGTKPQLLPNMVDLPQTSSLRLKDRRLDKGIILCVGRFMPEKGHSVLIKSFSKVLEQFPKWRLRLVGDGPLRSEIFKKCEKLGVAGSVDFVGVKKTLSDEYSQADLVVVPSEYEAFGLVAAEAMASGCCVIGFSDCLGLNQFIKNLENGILVEPGLDRSKSLAKKINWVINSPALRGDIAFRSPKTVQQFSPEKIVSQWEQYLLNVAGLEVSNE